MVFKETALAASSRTDSLAINYKLFQESNSSTNSTQGWICNPTADLRPKPAQEFGAGKKAVRYFLPQPLPSQDLDMNGHRAEQEPRHSFNRCESR